MAMLDRVRSFFDGFFGRFSTELQLQKATPYSGARLPPFPERPVSGAAFDSFERLAVGRR